MRATRPTMLVLMALCAAGCAVASAQPRPAGGNEDQCTPTRAEIAATIARGGACTAATDCAMYPGGVRGVTDCGGLTDATTAANVRSLMNRLLLVCRPGQLHQMSCAPTSCLAGCEEGRCVCHHDTTAPAPAPARHRRHGH